jgi:PBP1b-binding outer membrane lipoprotein LpoB
MRIRFAPLTAITLAAAITFLAGCSKGTSNNSTANAGNTTASPATTPTQPSSTPMPPTGNAGAATPTAAFTAYYEAIKRKDVATVRSLFSKGTLSMMEERAKRSNTTVDEVMTKGLEEASKEIPAAVPETRNEKIDGDKATLEAKDDKKDSWETLHFAREDGQWKIAFDER